MFIVNYMKTLCDKYIIVVYSKATQRKKWLPIAVEGRTGGY